MIHEIPLEEATLHRVGGKVQGAPIGLGRFLSPPEASQEIGTRSVEEVVLAQCATRRQVVVG